MNAPADPDFSQPMPPYQDSKALLMVFGVLICLASLGCGCGSGGYMLAVPFLMDVTTKQDPNFPPEMAALMETFKPVMWISAGMYLLLGLGGTWLGIGSCLCRRWACKLLEALGWLWAALMLVNLLNIWLMLPSILGMVDSMMAAMPPPRGTPSSAVPPSGFLRNMGGMLGVIYTFEFLFAAMPGVLLIILYRLRSVRLTCEYRDPVARWTDPVPVPVLAAWLGLASGAFMMLICTPLYAGLAGGFTFGIPPVAGGVGSFAIAAALGFAAWRIAKMDVIGLWVALIVMVLSFGLSLWLFPRLDIGEMFRQMGVPEKDMTELNKLFSKPIVLWPGMLLMGTLLIGYLASLFRFFRRPVESAPLAP